MDTRTRLLISELNRLLRLTQAAAMTAQARRAQAASRDVQRAFAAAGRAAMARSRAIGDAITDLGGVPDLVGALVGRVGAGARLQLEQVQAPPSALLDDLALEREILERTRFTRDLAEHANHKSIVELATGLEEAQTERIAWLEERLREVAAGADTEVRSTPIQSASGFVRGIAALPARPVMGGLNRAMGQLRQLRRRAEQLVEGGVDQAGRAAEAVEAGAEEAGDAETVEVVHTAREELGAMEPDELPIPDYDQLNAHKAVRALRELDDPRAVESVRAYESAHKNRKTVLAIADEQLQRLRQAASR